MNSGDIKENRSFVEKRKSRRIEYHSKIYCIKSTDKNGTEDYEEPLELELINISTGGLCIASGKLFEKDSVLVLRITLEDVCYEKVTARVIWTLKQDNTFRHGLEIVNISGSLYRHLSRLDNSITAKV